MAAVKVQSIAIDEIYIVGTRRELDDKAVDTLAGSLTAIGLRQPITVRWCDRIEDADGGYALVVGRHRLEAAKRLGWTWIDAIVTDWDETDARLWEIAENLHRAELTVQQRSEQIAEWVKITEERLSAQVAPKTKGRPESGVNAASRELGIERTQVQRAVKIASIGSEAKDAAAQAGLTNSQRALLSIASAPKAEQLARVHEIAATPKQKAIDGDIKQRAADYVAEVLAERPSGEWPAIKEALYDAGAKNIATALANLIGTAVMDRRYGA